MRSTACHCALSGYTDKNYSRSDTLMKEFTNQQMPIEDLPHHDTIEFCDLHPKYPQVALIATAINLLVILILVIAFVVFTPKATLNWFGGSLLIVLPLLILWYQWRSSLVKKYALREHDLIYRSGLIWQQTTAVSFNRIQHIDLTCGPLERRYDIASLKFFTAGGSSVDLKIPGLAQTDAQKIRTMILDKTAREDDDK